jgi:dihydroflavonol-4-reductase
MSKNNFTIDKSKPVLVTGATGYVAGVLIKELLEEGVTVHATVRDTSKKDRVQYLQNVADKSPGRIQFFSADLLTNESFAESMKGCTIVFHTASPFVLSVSDAQRDLVDPAVEGTENVLLEANKTPSVKRIVLTSSVAAIHCDASDAGKTANGILTEEHWNRKSTLEYGPYALSKTLAEQKAWLIAGSQTQWTLVTINPSMIMGPGLKYHASSESYKLFISIAGGELATGAPAYAIGIVDVRDVAHAHVVAAFNEEAKGRHILNGTNSSIYEIGAALRPKYAEYPLPARMVPFFILYLFGPFIGVSRTSAWNNIGVKMSLDNSKSKRELGIEYKSLEETLGDMMEQLIAEDVIKKK